MRTWLMVPLAFLWHFACILWAFRRKENHMNQTEQTVFTQLVSKLDVLIAKVDALEAQIAAQPQLPDNTADIQAQLDKANAELAKFP